MSQQKPYQPIREFDPSFLDKYDNIIFDMDGVVWLGHVFMPGIVDTLNALQQPPYNKKIFFCTNNSTQHRSSYYPSFVKAGLNFPDNSLYTSASTAASHVYSTIFNNTPPCESKSESKVLVIGQPGLQQEVIDFGLKDNMFTLDDLRSEKTSTLHGAKQFVVDPDIKAVVSGLQTDFSYRDCALAVMIIRENDAQFIATNRDVTFPAGRVVNKRTGDTITRLLPGAGSVINSIEGSCGKQAEVMGKPTRYMIEAIQRDHPSVQLSRTLMVGDRLDTDIAFGNQFGMDTLLVFSGVTHKDDYIVGKDIIFSNQPTTITQNIPTTPPDPDTLLPTSPLPTIDLADPTIPRPTYCADNINFLLKA